jgi:hypothetical protein
MLGLDTICLSDINKSLDRVDDVENGHICTGFGQAFSKCQTASSSTPSDQSSATFERELVYW